jgi:AraC-like DNA-binding protein
MSLHVWGSRLVRSASTPDNLTIQFDLGSTRPNRHNGQLMGAADLLLYSGQAEYERYSSAEHNGMNFRIPMDEVLSALALRAPGAKVLPALGQTLVAIDCAQSVQRIRAVAAPLLQWTKGEALPPLSAESVSARLSDVLIGAVLEPWLRTDGARPERPYYQRLPILRRAEEYMRAHLDQPLMLHDICGAARASERSVEYAFQESYGVGVKHYLRLLRLAHVHRELRRSWASGALVRELAARYGFWHLGHFAAAYRKVYGETPRQTMRARATEPAQSARCTGRGFQPLPAAAEPL